MERKFGLIGFPLSHSFSASYFAKKFACEGIQNTSYSNYPIENIDLLPALIHENDELLGLNVTIPYKTQVIPFLHKLSESAQEIGAVNTIKIIRKNNQFELHGFNTDEFGFKESLQPHLKYFHKKALILGTGGASKAVEYVLKSLNINYLLVSRTPKTNKEIAYSDLNDLLIHDHKIIINTSPVGMYPNIYQHPELPYMAVTDEHLFYDLIYNPAETSFMHQGALKGAKTINGLQMLHLQAEKAWEIWNT